jgi:hypothetical protein
MRRSVVGMAAIVVLACCQRSRESASAFGRSSPQSGQITKTPSAPEVKVWGALRAIMHEEKSGPQVTIADAIAGGHAYGVGALSGLQGECTIVDGVVWVARVREGGDVQVTNAPSVGESATLLVIARVPAWRSVVIANSISPDELDDRLEGMARANGIDVEQPFPLMVEGDLEGVDWHVLNGSRGAVGAGHDEHMRGAATGTLRGKTASLVGFFSKHHEGIFTHMGQRTHLHVLTSNHSITGHADRAAIRAGSVLKLPVPL